MIVHKKNYLSCRPIGMIALYLFFGLIHEVAHVLTFVLLSSTSSTGKKSVVDVITQLQLHDVKSISMFLLQAFFGRYCALSLNHDIAATTEGDSSEFILTASRHAGWMASFLIAIALHFIHHHRVSNNRKNADVLSSPTRLLTDIKIAAYATAVDAITTDLFGLVPSVTRPSPSSPSSYIHLFCGNFGVILLNSAWLKEDGGKTALDVLEKMVHVTMMRGAQCGGVVTFEENNNKTTSPIPTLTGVRSRVVNSKRTDLSKGVRRKVEKDSCYRFTKQIRGSSQINENSPVKGFFGHTRFATTSKVTFDGCHPHQWTPPSKRHVYYPFAAKSTEPATRTTINVENFITHNGDLDFYQINGKNYDLSTIQGWLEYATESKMPTSVDSCAIAGLVDLLRTQGCFALSARYAVSFCLSTSKMETSPTRPLPTFSEYEHLGNFFEKELDAMLPNFKNSLDLIASSESARADLVQRVYKAMKPEFDSNNYDRAAISRFVRVNDDEMGGASLRNFIDATINAFFDNDLLQTTKTFLANAKGSFGLCITSSLDAHKQVCIAARGQSMSIAFYPSKGLICYGSEQAAVKAGLNYTTPGGDGIVEESVHEASDVTRRLDLDDLGGEICLLDWTYKGDAKPVISVPNREYPTHTLMNGSVSLVIVAESQVNKDKNQQKLNSRMNPLEGNDFVKPLGSEPDDPVGYDISDIPRACNAIQEDWQEIGLNRLTAWNFSRSIGKKMQAIYDGKVNRNAESVDILLTGCEVSLWMAEQFASDLSRAFPKLFIKAVSSNKLLGLYGQELTVPCVGFPLSEKNWELDDPIVIIVSHSGGTFAPLACSNLLQSATRNIFVVTSEWDTQISKQLRQLYDEKEIISSRIFSTEVGVRPAEPCSVSVAATHQLLTNLFEYTCMVIVGNTHYRHVSGAVITEADLRILERCNRVNISALEEIVGFDRYTGDRLDDEFRGTVKELKHVGDRWAEHVLENVRAYIMSFIYIVTTVTIGYPLVSGIAYGAGLRDERYLYITRFFDALIYFWLPQINITILRLIQGRPLLHRMVARSVAIADVPWVAQAGEAFLSKLFACSYSIAGLNVISGNPSDHFVHRHTHRVVRGSLLVCGRPDGRLSSLTSLEATVCLSVNQASSIQSLGSTCESITIGHNPYKLPLSFRGIFLSQHRPKFLCETALLSEDTNGDIGAKKSSNNNGENNNNNSFARNSVMRKLHREKSMMMRARRSSLSNSSESDDEVTSSKLNKRSSSTWKKSVKNLFKDKASRDDAIMVNLSRHDNSSHNLLGQYTDMKKVKNDDNNGSNPMAAHMTSGKLTIQEVLGDMLRDKAGTTRYRELFDEIDTDKSGYIDEDEFVVAMKRTDPTLSEDDIRKIFREADTNDNGQFEFHEFLDLVRTPQADLMKTLQQKDRNDAGLSTILPSDELYFGEEMRKRAPKSVPLFELAKSQNLAMELYESRIASLQRFVAMTVLFHQISKRVENFFSFISFGLLGYRMDRTHSIMRIATTASPVSGADVRERMEYLRISKTIKTAVSTIGRAWFNHRDKEMRSLLKQHKQKSMKGGFMLTADGNDSTDSITMTSSNNSNSNESITNKQENGRNDYDDENVNATASSNNDTPSKDDGDDFEDEDRITTQ